MPGSSSIESLDDTQISFSVQIYSLDKIFHAWNYSTVTWEVEYSNEFECWWLSLLEDEQVSLNSSVLLLEQRGPHLPYPHSSSIKGSRHPHLRELRTQHRGRPYRTLYALDPRRTAILLIGGDKTGQDQWYEHFVPLADRLYDEHIEQLIIGGLIDG